MTWVVGEATAYGYSVLVSDSQISCSNGTVPGIGVQKTHQVGRSLAAGFAGSIKIGFALVEELRRAFAESSSPFWLQSDVEDLKQRLKNVFHTYDVAYRNGGAT
jgi:ATP-dependent protease HslVU (ClpYQ) peptidase subunit